MSVVTIELQPQRAQSEFNLRRWSELLEDRELARIEGRIETDRHGHIIMSPPPAASHGNLQFRIARLLSEHLPEGEVHTECPISTADGVKAADIAWASPECMLVLGNRACFPRSPEICVEVISPGNTKAEIDEKMELYFDAGAKEVWLCSSSGEVSFYLAGSNKPAKLSEMCPEFPHQIPRRRSV
jgi:Uma2 family endonuclease